MAGLDGFGTVLERSDMGDPATFTEVANVSSISGPSISRETIDVTAHDSPDAYREFLGGLKDPGEISLELNWDPEDTTHADLASDLDDTVARDWRLILPGDIAYWEFTAFLTAFETSYPIDDKITGSATLKITSKPTLTLGAPV